MDCFLNYTQGIVATGLSGTSFTFTIYNINNPGTAGSTGNINIQILNSNYAVLSCGSLAGIITSPPSAVKFINITLNNYDIQAVTNYSFFTTISAVPSSI